MHYWLHLRLEHTDETERV